MRTRIPGESFSISRIGPCMKHGLDIERSLRPPDMANALIARLVVIATDAPPLFATSLAVTRRALNIEGGCRRPSLSDVPFQAGASLTSR